MTLFRSSTSSGSSDMLTSAAISQFPPGSALVDDRFGADLDANVAAALSAIEAALTTAEPPGSKPLNGNAPNSSDRFTPPLLASYTSAIRARDTSIHGDVMVVTRRWEGSVLRIYSNGVFDAKLCSLTDEDLDVTAEFSVEDLSDDDRSLLAPGAIFYVTEGHERKSGGRVRRASDIRFRRLGRWSEEEIADLLEMAKQRRAALGFGEEP